MARKRTERKSRPRSIKSSTLAAEAYAIPADEIVFQDEEVLEGGSLTDHIMTLYGPPKIGKTTLMSKLKGIYYLPTEPGYKWVMCRKSYIPNWATFIQFIKYMEKNKAKCKKVSFFCIDTVDNLSKFCMMYVCGREGIAHPSDGEWGAGWEAFRDEFTHWILRLCSLGCGVAFISHEKEREVISRSVKITKMSPDLPKTSYTVINNLCDIILRMSFTTIRKKVGGKAKRFQSRCLFTKPDESYDAGDRTGRLPEIIPFKTEAEAVEKIVSYYS